MAQRRLYPPIYFFTSVLLMLALHFGFPVHRWLVGPWRYWGVSLIVAGAAVAFRVDAEFKRRGTTIRPFEESSSLVTDGLFGYSRNPIYASMVVVLVGVALLLGTVTPLVVPPAFAWVIARRFIHDEERMLERRFGEEYVAYKSRVRRWF